MPTRYAGTEPETRALNALINLSRAADAVHDSLHPGLAAGGLTPSQFGVLEALLHLGPLHQGELAGKLLRSCGSVTSVVEGLEGRGLVRRRRGEGDKRFVRVELTSRGRERIERVFPGHAAAAARRFSALSPKEQEELRRLCRKLGRAGEGP